MRYHDAELSALKKGDLGFSQQREAIYARTPDQEVMEAEELKLPAMTLREAIAGSEGIPLSDEEMQERVRNWRIFLDYIFQGGISNPWAAFKNLLAVVRRVNPSYLDGVSQTELGILLNETRAAPSAREIRVVEGLLKRWGVAGFHLLGGTKSETARERCAEAQRGNQNRRLGKKQKYKLN